MSRVITADRPIEDESIPLLSRKVMREINGLDEEDSEDIKTETLTTLGRFHVDLIGAYFNAGTYTVVYFNNDPLNVEDTPAEIDYKITQCYEQGSKNKTD